MYNAWILSLTRKNLILLVFYWFGYVRLDIYCNFTSVDTLYTVLPPSNQYMTTIINESQMDKRNIFLVKSYWILTNNVSKEEFLW